MQSLSRTLSSFARAEWPCVKRAALAAAAPTVQFRNIFLRYRDGTHRYPDGSWQMGHTQLVLSDNEMRALAAIGRKFPRVLGFGANLVDEDQPSKPDTSPPAGPYAPRRGTGRPVTTEKEMKGPGTREIDCGEIEDVRTLVKAVDEFNDVDFDATNTRASNCVNFAADTLRLTRKLKLRCRAGEYTSSGENARDVLRALGQTATQVRDVPSGAAVSAAAVVESDALLILRA